jgi:hypothetical protein
MHDLMAVLAYRFEGIERGLRQLNRMKVAHAEMLQVRLLGLADDERPMLLHPLAFRNSSIEV